MTRGPTMTTSDSMVLDGKTTRPEPRRQLCPTAEPMTGRLEASRVPSPERARRGSRYEVVVSEGGAGADECVAADGTQLQARVLRHHAVFHERRHEQPRSEGQERTIANDAEHQLRTLRDVHIASNDAVVDHGAGADRNVVTDGGGSVDHHRRVDHAISTYANQPRALQDLPALVQGVRQDAQLERRIVLQPLLEPRRAGKQAEDDVRHDDMHPGINGHERPQRDLEHQIAASVCHIGGDMVVANLACFELDHQRLGVRRGSIREEPQVGQEQVALLCVGSGKRPGVLTKCRLVGPEGRAHRASDAPGPPNEGRKIGLIEEQVVPICQRRPVSFWQRGTRGHLDFAVSIRCQQASLPQPKRCVLNAQVAAQARKRARWALAPKG